MEKQKFSLMKVCATTTGNCGPNVKGCGVLVIFPCFGSGMDRWKSSCPKNVCPWLHKTVIWKSCFPAIHWLKITSLYWLILIFFCVHKCFKINSKILLWVQFLYINFCHKIFHMLLFFLMPLTLSLVYSYIFFMKNASLSLRNWFGKYFFLS